MLQHDVALPDRFVPLESQPVATDLHLGAGLFVKHCTFDEGSYIPQHAHEHDHWSIIATGAVRAWEDGKPIGEYRAPSGVLIRARIKHTFLALEPNTTVLCVHRLDGEGEVPIHEAHELEF